MKHLPYQAQEIAAQQGWDDESIIIHLLGFIKENVPMPEAKLASYFSEIADEENQSIDSGV